MIRSIRCYPSRDQPRLRLPKISADNSHDTMLYKIEPKNADQNPETSKPFRSEAASQKHKALTTRMNNPSVPIVPGIMPITNYSQLMRFSEMCGAEVPRWVAKRLESYGDDREAIRAFGLDVVTQLCERLVKEGAPGLHFYTLNGAAATKAICERLG
jgi:hypothetical protein